MRIIFELDENLPKLSWHASADTRTGQCTVFHGAWVEISNRGFIEGTWDGDFEKFGFNESAIIFGSGAICLENKIVFVSSTSTTDCLYYSSTDTQINVSNSLPFILAATNDQLDETNTEYQNINESITFGINQYIKSIPTKGGAVTRIIHRNLVLNTDGIFEADKINEPNFKDFQSYYNYLIEKYERIVENATDKHRKYPMDIFSTQSRGYDSTAVNAIAKNYGIKKVFTVTTGKAKGYFMQDGKNREPDDDGTAICERFNLNPIPLLRHNIKSIEENEYLVFATLHESGDINLLEITTHINRPTILLTGCLGEIWYTEDYYTEHPNYICSDLIRGDLGNHGMTESRLQAGYVQLAFPFIGARSRSDIFAITTSPEMDPWRLCTAYDRPIPRRIAENAGLQREMFGQTKMASVIELPSPIIPIGKSLKNEYLEYLVSVGLLNKFQLVLIPLVRRWNGIVTMTSPKRHLWNYYLQRIISKIIRKDFNFSIIWSSLNSSIFCYCVNKRKQDYENRINQKSASYKRITPNL